MTTPRQQFISDDHYAALIGAIKSGWAADTMLDTAILLLFLTGMRQDELVRIGADSLDTERMAVFVDAAKGSRKRWIPLHEELRPRLEELRSHLGPHLIGAMFSHSDEIKSQKRTLRNTVHRLFDDVCGPNHYTVHSIRHTFARRCLKTFDRDMRKVQLALGHRCISSTAHYLEAYDSDSLRDDILKAVEE